MSKKKASEMVVDRDEDRRFYQKYNVQRLNRLNDRTGRYDGCEFFVLDLDHDRYAKIALLAYAGACEEEFPLLSRNLLERCKRMGS